MHSFWDDDDTSRYFKFIYSLFRGESARFTWINLTGRSHFWIPWKHCNSKIFETMKQSIGIQKDLKQWNKALQFKKIWNNKTKCCNSNSYTTIKHCDSQFCCKFVYLCDFFILPVTNFLYFIYEYIHYHFCTIYFHFLRLLCTGVIPFIYLAYVNLLIYTKMRQNSLSSVRSRFCYNILVR